MTEVLLVVGGVVVGALLRGSLEHRLWLRDARRDAYAAFLEALDRLMDARDAYMRTFCFVVERLAVEGVTSGPVESWSPNVASELDAEWQALRAVSTDFDRQRARVELLGSDPMDRIVILLRIGHRRPLPPWSFEGPQYEREALENDCQQWRDQSASVSADRQKFLKSARDDLRVSPWDPRRLARRLRGLVSRKRPK